MNKADLETFLNNPHKITGGKYVLLEKGNDATLKQVEICNIPCDSIVVKMEGKGVPSLLSVNKQKKIGFATHSEIAIITSTHVVLIEMKSKKELDKDLSDTCCKKFKSDLCMLTYVDTVFKEMLSRNKYFENAQLRYVLLYQSVSIPKTPIGSNNTHLPLNDRPEKFRCIEVVNEAKLDFAKLL